MQATRENVMKRLLLLFLLCFGLALPGVAADGTSFNPTTISVKSVGASIPVGTVITWPSNSWPSDRDNWLECNGQSISSAVYPELVGVVGWNVPNYQGVFLRGYGGQTRVRIHYFQGRKTGYAGSTEVSHAYPVLSFRKSVGAKAVLSPFSRYPPCG